MKKGFIGLGNLGKALTERLIERGHDMAVYNRTPSKASDLNAVLFDSPRELTEHSDQICICLSDSRAVLGLFEGPDRITSVDISGKVFIDFSTHRHDQVHVLYDTIQQHGAHYLECPVLGSVAPARQGTLTLVAGGDAKGFEKAKPLLEDLSSSLFFLEKPGQATEIKLLNNMILASLMISITEALAFAESSGLSKETVLEILSKGAGGSIILNAKKAKLLDEDFSTHFSNALLFKDLTCAQDMALDKGKLLFSADFARKIYGKTFEKNIENDDFSGIYKLFKPS